MRNMILTGEKIGSSIAIQLRIEAKTHSSNTYNNPERMTQT